MNKNNKSDGLYLAPEILAGQKTTEKSIVFTLAVIWDELIHGQLYFKSMKDIESSQCNYLFLFSRIQGKRHKTQSNFEEYIV